MLKYDFNVILPSCLCSNSIFPNFINDLKKHGIKNILILVDYDMNEKTPLAHRSELRAVNSSMKLIAKQFSVKIKTYTNLLLSDSLCVPKDISAVYSGCRRKLFFVSLPIGENSEIAMKNIFVIKNLGFFPAISNFDNVAAMYPKKFCEALLTTENMYFIFNCDSLGVPKVDQYIKKAVSSNNTVLFSASHFTSSLIYKSIDRYIRILSKRYKSNLFEITHNAVRSIFK